jgi:hypothetical protein
MNLNDGLADEGGDEELSEGNAEVAAGYARQVEQRVGDGGAEQDCYEAVFLHVVEDYYLAFLDEAQVWLLAQHFDLAYLLVLELLLAY